MRIVRFGIEHPEVDGLSRDSGGERRQGSRVLQGVYVGLLGLQAGAPPP